MDPVATLLARAASRLRVQRGLLWGARTGVVAFGLLVIEGVLARFVPMPGDATLRAVVMAAPFAAVAAGLSRPNDEREVRAEAGRWVGEPALLLAMNVDPSSLTPLIEAHAARKAEGAAAPARHIHPWVRAAVLLMVPAALAAFAPGRSTEVPLLDDDAVSQIRSTGRALAAEGLPDSVSRDHREAVRKALRNLDKADVKKEEVRTAVAELKAAIEDAGGTWDALTTAAAQAPLLEPTWQALDRGDTEAALQAVRELANKIRNGELKASDLQAATNALIAAVGGATDADKPLLDAAAKAMAAGDGSGLEAALAELLPRTGPPDAKTRGLEKAVVALEAALGRPGGEPGTEPAVASGVALIPRGDAVKTAIDAFGEGDLAPRQREILRKYFAHDR